MNDLEDKFNEFIKKRNKEKEEFENPPKLLIVDENIVLPELNEIINEHEIVLIKDNEKFFLSGVIDIFNNILMDNMNKTCCYSAFSIAYLLTLIYIGSTGKVREEIKKILMISIDDDTLKTEIMKLIDVFISNEQVKMNISNGIYISDKLETSIDEEYKNFITKIGQISIEDFKKSREIVSKINEWISQKTNNLINNMLSDGDIKTETLMVMINAIYFKSQWKNKFKIEDTKRHKFTTSSGKKLHVNMMFRQGKYNYYENEYFQLIEIPYSDSSYVMNILLPKNNIKHIKTQIDGLEYILHETEVCLYIPKFTIDLKIDMNGLLSKIGMSSLFEKDNGLLETVIKDTKLFIDKIIHQAKIIVNEEGTEAVAATVNIMLKCHVREHYPFIFKADHPFQYQIVHKPSKIVLFSGLFNG